MRSRPCSLPPRDRAAALLLLALGAAALASCRGPEARPTAPAERALATALVETRSGSREVAVDAVVVGRTEATLSSRLAGTVVEVRAIPGRTVHAGELLVRLDARETEGSLEGARAARSAAEAALALAERSRLRFESLSAKGAAAAVELDRARQDEAAARAAVAAADAQLRRAETDRAQAVLVAPFDALVVEKLVSAGDLAAPGRPLVRLASRTGRRVEAAPSEEEAARLAVGETLAVALGGAAPTETITGRVVEVAGAVDPATRRRTVRVELPPGAEPPVGSYARLFLPAEGAPRIAAPSRAVVTRGGLTLAFALDAERRVSVRYVRTGPALPGGFVEIRSGLSAGERVVLDPPADLASGTRVVEAAPAGPARASS